MFRAFVKKHFKLTSKILTKEQVCIYFRVKPGGPVPLVHKATLAVTCLLNPAGLH